MTPKHILSIFTITAGVAMIATGIALSMSSLLIIGIPLAAIGVLLFLL